MGRLQRRRIGRDLREILQRPRTIGRRRGGPFRPNRGYGLPIFLLHFRAPSVGPILSEIRIFRISKK